MDKSSKRWSCRIPFLVALIATAAAGLTGNALAVSPAPDPAPGPQVSPRPDAAGATSAPRSRTQSSRRSATTSTGSQTAPSTTTPADTETRLGSNTTPSRSSGGDTLPKSAVLSDLLSGGTPAVPAAAQGKRSGRDERLLLGAALALGTLTLASLGLVGLARRLRQEVALR